MKEVKKTIFYRESIVCTKCNQPFKTSLDSNCMSKLSLMSFNDAVTKIKRQNAGFDTVY